FRFNSAESFRSEDTLRFVYVGSVGGRYMLDRIGRFVAIASRENRVHLSVFTRTAREHVNSILRASGLSEWSWSVEIIPHSQVPARLAQHQVGIHFLNQGISEHGSSPTKIGEYWAMGLPVIATPNAGDLEAIIRSERVGVIVDEHTDAAYLRAV